MHTPIAVFKLAPRPGSPVSQQLPAQQCAHCTPKDPALTGCLRLHPRQPGGREHTEGKGVCRKLLTPAPRPERRTRSGHRASITTPAPYFRMHPLRLIAPPTSTATNRKRVRAISEGALTDYPFFKSFRG